MWKNRPCLNGNVYGVGAKGVILAGGSTVAVCTLERLRTIDVKSTRLYGSAVPI